jgi:hypothetical protein
MQSKSASFLTQLEKVFSSFPEEERAEKNQKMKKQYMLKNKKEKHLK